jgi:hypothetical protein
MRLTFLGKDTQGGNSPTLWETDDGHYVIQGFTLDAEALGQEKDYWLLDDDTLILSVFSPDGRTGGFAREPDPEVRRQCLVVRDQVWSRAIPYAQYVA